MAAWTPPLAHEDAHPYQTEIGRAALLQSDIVTFHAYWNRAKVEEPFGKGAGAALCERERAWPSGGFEDLRWATRGPVVDVHANGDFARIRVRFVE